MKIMPCIRVPRSVKIFHDGEMCAEMESVHATIDLLVLHDQKGRCWGTVRNMFYKACRNGSSLFGFTFEKDPHYVPSKHVMATDVESGESFVKSSVGEMSRCMFDNGDIYGVRKITRLCGSGRVKRVQHLSMSMMTTNYAVVNILIMKR